MNYPNRIFHFVGIPLIVLIAYFGLNYSGFCFAKIRYLGTEEKIRLAFEELNAAGKLRINIPGKDGKDVEFIKYKSFDEYIKENPNCCTFYASGGSPETPPPSFLERIFGYHSGTFVRIYYKVRYFDDNGEQRSQVIKADRPLRNCGDTVGYH